MKAFSEDEIWILVKRNINGSDTRYIEYFSPFKVDAQEDAHHVDAGTFYDGLTDDITDISAETVQDITGITNADPAVVTCVDHGYSNADTIRLGDCDMEELNGREFTVANKADDTFELSGEDSTNHNDGDPGTEGKVVKTPNITVTMTTALATLIWANDDSVFFRDILGMTELNGRRFVIEGVSGSDFDVDTLDTQDYTAYTEGGTAEKVVNEITGATELTGETVTILADGGVHAKKTVDGAGAFSLDQWANKIHYGLGFEATIKTMRIEAGKFMKKKRIPKVRLRFYETLGCEVGPDEDHLETISFRSGDDVYGTPPSLFTGDKEIAIPSTYSSENYIVVKHTDPTPFTLLAIGADVAIGG
ncbi:hypothetical protein ES703_96620 [subsurface metagenome]